MEAALLKIGDKYKYIVPEFNKTCVNCVRTIDSISEGLRGWVYHISIKCVCGTCKNTSLTVLSFIVDNAIQQNKIKIITNGFKKLCSHF